MLLDKKKSNMCNRQVQFSILWARVNWDGCGKKGILRSLAAGHWVLTLSSLWLLQGS